MLNPINFLNFIKSNNQRELDRITKIVAKINSIEHSYKKLNDEDFPKKTSEFKEKLKGESIDKIIPELCFGKGAAKRTRNERHFDVK